MVQWCTDWIVTESGLCSRPVYNQGKPGGRQIEKTSASMPNEWAHGTLTVHTHTPHNTNWRLLETLNKLMSNYKHTNAN